MAILDKLEQYDFNDTKGILSVVAVCIAISLVLFSLAYISEGIGWLGDSEHGWVGWNWLRGAGIAIGIAAALGFIAKGWLAKNASNTEKARPLFGKLDLNAQKGLMGLAALSVSTVFFFNGIFYRQEAFRWLWAAQANSISWMFTESSAWFTSSMVMIIIGIVLSAAGWILIALQWKSGTSKPSMPSAPTAPSEQKE